MSQNFEYYETALGNAVVEREIKSAKLSKVEASRLERVIRDAESGTLKPGDRKPIRGDVFELRVRCDRRTFRLLCADLRGTPVILALVFFAKKSRKLPVAKVDLAVDRLREYRERT